jgi:hypothetical protein
VGAAELRRVQQQPVAVGGRVELFLLAHEACALEAHLLDEPLAQRRRQLPVLLVRKLRLVAAVVAELMQVVVIVILSRPPKSAILVSQLNSNTREKMRHALGEWQSTARTNGVCMRIQ